ncbi:hypothetical protein V492_00284 [Pseudogymnoascus sp. VKM F-4246]|nr:hypothetical protein V492_00284 [Pseudogymnoascus sp. VKM F-4246]
MESSADQPEVCVPCGLQFINWGHYIRHIVTSGNHPHACSTCGQEFHSEEGKQAHQRLAHQPDQSLVCSGCHKEFTRCGSLVQHVEVDGCPVFRKPVFEKVRDANDDYYKKLGSKKQTTAPTTDTFVEASTALASRDPSEVLKGTARVNRTQSKVDDALTALASWARSEVDVTHTAPKNQAVEKDLLTEVEEAEYKELDKSFPVLQIRKIGDGKASRQTLAKTITDMNSPTKEKSGIDLIEMSPNKIAPKRAWSSLTGLKPFNIAAGGAENNSVQNENMPCAKEAPEHPPKYSGPAPNCSSTPNEGSGLQLPVLAYDGPESNVLQPLRKLKMGEPQLTAQASETTPEETAPKYYHDYDPDQPGFDLEKYRNPYSKKYRCAFAGCSKLLNSSEGLYMHLKSNAHLTDLYRCPICFKQFHSAAAITQHMESQTNRCNARADPRYRQIMDQVSAGMVGTAGTHEDKTHRYYSAQVVPQLQLDTAHEVKDEDIANAVNDPAYRAARSREHEQRLMEEKARVEAWQNDDWIE